MDIEDRRFYQHGGVDVEGIFRAAVDDFNAGHVVQGASTIEQQVVRNLYLDNDPTATRKLKEAWLAMQMADDWSKDKILTTYLNIVPYGGVTYGCEAAAEVYFSEHCANLGHHPVGDDRRSAAVAHQLQPEPPSRTPRSRAETTCCWRCTRTDDISHRQYESADRHARSS